MKAIINIGCAIAARERNQKTSVTNFQYGNVKHIHELVVKLFQGFEYDAYLKVDPVVISIIETFTTLE